MIYNITVFMKLSDENNDSVIYTNEYHKAKSEADLVVIVKSVLDQLLSKKCNLHLDDIANYFGHENRFIKYDITVTRIDGVPSCDDISDKAKSISYKQFDCSIISELYKVSFAKSNDKLIVELTPKYIVDVREVSVVITIPARDKETIVSTESEISYVTK